MFSKILVGIDGSESSIYAARYAIELSAKYDSELFLLSVIPSKVHHGDSSGVFGMVSPSFLNEYKKEAEKWFERIKEMIRKEEGYKNMDIYIDKKLKTDVITTPFSTGASILNYAEENGVDLIIVGTKGNSGLKRMLVGSVASDVVTYAYCPVMVIK